MSFPVRMGLQAEGGTEGAGAAALCNRLTDIIEKRLK